MVEVTLGLAEKCRKCRKCPLSPGSRGKGLQGAQSHPHISRVGFILIQCAD